MRALIIIDLCFAVTFLLCYAFQMAYLFIPLSEKRKRYPSAPPHKIAVLVAAKDEETVIGELIKSISEAKYPKEFLKVFVCADNCSDKTAEIAKEAGACVYERTDSERVGKGYVIDFLLSRIDGDFGKDFFDAFVVFDADNTVDGEYFTEVNKAFSAGYDVVTCYRNSKNYGDNWLSAGSGLWFIRESRYLNGSRMRIGACPQVSGTGFLFSNLLKNELGGWPYHTLTEDYEFTCDSVIKGRRFAYCEDAVFYDEQTSSLRQSFNQRLRWCKGGIQSFKKYGKGLFKALNSKNFGAAYDMLMSVAPAYIISVLATVINLTFALWMIAFGDYSVIEAFAPALTMAVGAYLVLLPHSIVPTITEWHRIKAKNYKKILYMFTFPIYMMTFIPACIVALFKKNVEWKKIDHGNKKDRK